VQNGITACVEIGASGVETVLLGPGTSYTACPGLGDVPAGAPLLVAVPGLVEGGRVLAASNLGWYDVDPAEQLGLPMRAAVVCNDAEAAALGEAVLRAGTPDLVFVGLGTGVGGAVVRDGLVVEANLFAHLTGFGPATCTCGQTGCLETVAGGWALPEPLEPGHLTSMAAALARAITTEPLAEPRLVVLGGGITRGYPDLVGLLQDALPGYRVEPSAATGTKSAAAWGLRSLHDRLIDLPSPAHA
jgi:predicted NBD/HSP70 family sugar kinase